MSKNLEQMVEDLSQLTVLEMSNLKSLLEEKWGVKAQAAAPMMMHAPVQQGAAQAQEESTEFEVTITEVPAASKIAVIKVLRELTGLGLKEAKDAVEAAPKVIKESAPKAMAEEMKQKLEASGAKVALKGL